MFTLTHLKYFITTVETGSMTQAAKALYISQPALSKQLSVLEKELHCTLLQRKTTGIELTDAGRFFYEKACSIVRESESLAAAMESFSGKKTIRIGTLPSIGSYFLPAVISKIGSSYQVELLIKDTTLELTELLDADAIDFAIVQDTQHVKSSMRCKSLFWEPYDAVVPASETLESKSSLAEFLQQKLILHKNPCDIRRYFEAYCGNQSLDFQVFLDLESNESIIPFVSKGLGASILPRMVTRQLSTHLVQIVLLEDEQLKRRIDFLYKPMLAKIARELLTCCEESVDEVFAQ